MRNRRKTRAPSPSETLPEQPEALAPLPDTEPVAVPEPPTESADLPTPGEQDATEAVTEVPLDIPGELPAEVREEPVGDPVEAAADDEATEVAEASLEAPESLALAAAPAYTLWERINPIARRRRQLSRMENGYHELLNLVLAIRQNLDNQSHTQDILINALKDLPEAVGSLKNVAIFSEQNGAMLQHMQSQLDTGLEHNRHMGHSVEQFNATLKSMDKTTQILAERSRETEQLLHKMLRRSQRRSAILFLGFILLLLFTLDATGHLPLRGRLGGIFPGLVTDPPPPAPEPQPEQERPPAIAPLPTATPKPTPKPTPLPTSTPVPVPTEVPAPVPTVLKLDAVVMAAPTAVPAPTATPIPAATPKETATEIPTVTPVAMPTDSAEQRRQRMVEAREEEI